MGLILAIAPWTAFWDRNRFIDGQTRVEAFAQSHYARGAVTGVGLITVLAGLGELGGAVAGRLRRADAHGVSSNETPGS